MLNVVIAAVKDVAKQDIMPRYLKMARYHKADGSLCTEADIATQKTLLRKLQKIYPGAVVSEEMSKRQQTDKWIAGDAGLWCIDPIDGTTNFVNGLPYFAVSVALMRHGRSVLSVVCDPVTHEIFYAEKGNGAYLNGEKLPIKEYTPTLRDALARVDLKRLNSITLETAISTMPPFFSQCNYGACALEWCFTAASRFNFYLHSGQKIWDYAAGCLILEEAGGHLCGFDQNEFWKEPLWQRSIIAALNPSLFLKWRDWVRLYR